MPEEIPSETVWEGRIGDTPLRVGIQPSGRLIATWRVKGADRRSLVDTVEQLERTVLLQLLLAASPTDDAVAQEVLDAVEAAKAGRPEPTADRPKPRKRRPSRRGAPPRRRR